MTRLIDADALKEMICSHVYPVVDYFNNKDYGMFWTGGIEKIIDEQPTIDAIPVVRCKVCKNWRSAPCTYTYKDGTGCKEENTWCVLSGGVVEPDDYCSKAERKEE